MRIFGTVHRPRLPRPSYQARQVHRTVAKLVDALKRSIPEGTDSQCDSLRTPVRTLTEGDWHEVNGTFEKALKSFRFLK